MKFKTWTFIVLISAVIIGLFYYGYIKLTDNLWAVKPMLLALSISVLILLLLGYAGVKKGLLTIDKKVGE